MIYAEKAFSLVNGEALIIHSVNPLNANPEKWSNTLKQIVGNLTTICLSVFDHFMNLALKGLILYELVFPHLFQIAFSVPLGYLLLEEVN